MQILDGKLVSSQLYGELQSKVGKWVEAGYEAPHLAAILVGNDPPSQIYINNKIRTCQKIGFKSTLHHLEDSVTEKELLHLIDAINKDKGIHGLIVQLPLPEHISPNAVILATDPEKDVDGFHPVNIGKMTLGIPTLLPATPQGILMMLEHYAIPTKGKHGVVVGRSNIVGTPISILLSRNSLTGNATVTLAHSHTQDLESLVKQADILVVAIGRPDFVRGSWIKPGAVVIDVGTSRVEDPSSKTGYRLRGDVHFEEAAEVASYITPVPGGVGPMTIASLINNTYKAAAKQQGIPQGMV